jgi:WD40 repeat protein
MAKSKAALHHSLECEYNITCMNYNADGTLFVTAACISDEEPIFSVTVWDVASGNKRVQFRASHDIKQILFLPDNESYACVGIDNILIYKNDKKTRKIAYVKSYGIDAVYFSKDGTFIATITREYEIDIYLKVTLKQMSNLRSVYSYKWDRKQYKIVAGISMSEDNKTIFISNSTMNSKMIQWETNTVTTFDALIVEPSSPPHIYDAIHNRLYIPYASNYNGKVISFDCTKTNKPIEFTASNIICAMKLQNHSSELEIVSGDGNIYYYNTLGKQEHTIIRLNDTGYTWIKSVILHPVQDQVAVCIYKEGFDRNFDEDKDDDAEKVAQYVTTVQLFNIEHMRDEVPLTKRARVEEVA